MSVSVDMTIIIKILLYEHMEHKQTDEVHCTGLNLEQFYCHVAEKSFLMIWPQIFDFCWIMTRREHAWLL